MEFVGSMLLLSDDIIVDGVMDGESVGAEVVVAVDIMGKPPVTFGSVALSCAIVASAKMARIRNRNIQT